MLDSTRFDSMMYVRASVDFLSQSWYCPPLLESIPLLSKFVSQSLLTCNLLGSVIEQDIVLLVGKIVLLFSPAFFLLSRGGDDSGDWVRRLRIVPTPIQMLVRRVGHGRSARFAPFFAAPLAAAVVSSLESVIVEAGFLCTHKGFHVLKAVVEKVSLLTESRNDAIFMRCF